MPTSQLLDAAFARELEVLRRRLQVRARSGAGGDHVARRRGGSAEFSEHRPYTPGDDLRRIDWMAFARTGEPVFKLFRAEEDVVVRVVLDASGSLATGDPPKMTVAKKLAASVAYIALADSERAQIMVATDGVTHAHEPTRGRASLPRVLRELDLVAPKGGTDLAKAIDGAVLRSGRPGMLVVVSDFLDPGPFGDAIARAASQGHDVALLQVLAPEDINPPYDGDLCLEDDENGAAVDVTLDARAVQAYLARLDALVGGLRRLAKRHRATYVKVPTTEPLLAAIRRFVSRSID